jgi:hypothetical protein
MMSERCGIDLGPMQNLAAYVARLRARPALEAALAL